MVRWDEEDSTETKLWLYRKLIIVSIVWALHAVANLVSRPRSSTHPPTNGQVHYRPRLRKVEFARLLMGEHQQERTRPLFPFRVLFVHRTLQVHPISSCGVNNLITQRCSLQIYKVASVNYFVVCVSFVFLLALTAPMKHSWSSAIIVSLSLRARVSLCAHVSDCRIFQGRRGDSFSVVHLLHPPSCGFQRVLQEEARELSLFRYGYQFVAQLGINSLLNAARVISCFVQSGCVMNLFLVPPY